MTRQKQITDFFGLETLTEKTINFGGKDYTIRIPSMIEMQSAVGKQDEDSLHNFVLSLIKGFPADITWKDVLELPPEHASAISSLVLEVLKSVSPSQADIKGN